MDHAGRQLLDLIAHGARGGRLPAAHRAFLEATAPSFEMGGYFFCHAGVRPGLPLANQAMQDLLWIRDEFLRSEAQHGRMVVHGHTPTQEPEFRANRINLDTGAYASNVLTCLRLEGDGGVILAAGPQGVSRSIAPLGGLA
jgi:serine/threonine protein phosphatase 1